MKKLLILALFFCLIFFSFLVNETKAEITNRSEIRGWYIADKVDNWDVVAETAKDYKINMLVPGCLWLYGAIYPSKYAFQFYGTPPSRDELALALQAAHSRGIEVHCLMLTFFIWSGFPKDLPIPEDWKAVNCNNETVNWADPCNPHVRELIKNLTTELASNYDIDGFMFDYIRYDETGYSGQESYSKYCKDWFENDTGINVTNWPADVCPDGKYRDEWMKWRVTPITKMVEDVRKWMLAIKPDLKFSAAVFTIFSKNAYAYWRYDIGQDTANWVGKDYLDMVTPMCYTGNLEEYKQYITNSTRYFVGTKEGKIPIAIWTSSGRLDSRITPETIKSLVESCREVGCDGWMIWGYGGPGNPNPDAPDLRAAFQLIDLPDTFSLGSVKAFPLTNEATITWITDRPTTSKVEYSTSPLFVPNFTSGSWGNGFPYWDIVYNPGIIVEDNSNVTVHSITLKNLQPNTTYYFRVQSKDNSGTVTSKVYNFTTGTENYPISISGKITDSEDGSPVKAIVYCGNSGNVSDSNGNYVIRLKSSGSCDLTAESFGYKTKKIPISFSGSITQDISLEPIKVSVGGNIKNKTGEPVKAEIELYKQGSLISSTQTDPEGNYSLPVRKGIYDVLFKIPDFLANFWIKFPSLNLLSDLENKIKEVTIIGPKKISFVTDIRTNEIIEINSNKPSRVFFNGSEMGQASSFDELKSNQWYYDSSAHKLYLKLDPYPKTECIFECCKNETHYYDKPCSSDYYCEDRICKPKTSCPFECCKNEEKYLDKSCNYPYKCFDRKCVDVVGYWKFDEGSGNIAYDSSRMGNNGTIYGATWSTNCISGYCLRFDGKDDRIGVPHSPTLNFNEDFTLEAWVRPLGPWTGGFPGVIAKYWPTGYLLGIDNSTQKWTFLLKNESSPWVTIHSDSQVEFNKWIHLAVVKEKDNKVKMYINGTLQAETATFPYTLNPSNRFEIGTWDALRFFNGTIDEVRVYQRALSEGEIFEHVHPNWPKCSDGTLYGFCSKTKPLYCKDGVLVNNCSYCGCPSGEVCDGLNEVCYPYQNMQTFGKWEIGSSSTEAIPTDFIYGSKFTLPEEALVTNISVYAYFGASYNKKYKALIYDDLSGSPGNLKGVSREEIFNEGWQWYNFTFSPAIHLIPGDYWLMVWSNVSWYLLKYDSGGFHAYKNVTYDTPPNPFGTPDGTGNYNISIYATYIPI